MFLLNTAAARPYVVSFAALITSIIIAARSIHGSVPRDYTERTVKVLKSDNDTNRTENLLPDDPHVRFNIGEECRIDEISLVPETITTEVNFGTFRFPGVDVRHDTLSGGHRSIRNLRSKKFQNGTYVELNF